MSIITPEQRDLFQALKYIIESHDDCTLNMEELNNKIYFVYEISDTNERIVYDYESYEELDEDSPEYIKLVYDEDYEDEEE